MRPGKRFTKATKTTAASKNWSVLLKIRAHSILRTGLSLTEANLYCVGRGNPPAHSQFIGQVRGCLRCWLDDT
jgi:hypothetical protein